MGRLTSAAVLTTLAGFSLGCGSGPKATPTVTPAAAATGVPREEVLGVWQRALALYRHGKWGKAATQLERVVLELPPGDTLATEARFRLAECYLGQRNQLQAAREFRKVSDEAPSSRLAPEALLRVGDAYADLWRRPELDPTYGQTALGTYQELLSRYPDTPAAARARLRIGELEDWFARKDLKSALYYYRLKAYDSAILYLKDIAAKYPRASVTPQALLKLVAAYRTLGYAEDLQETCGYLRRFHPAARGVNGACPAPKDTTVGATGSR